MNWAEINGKRSTDVKGLLISELPPISKPLMRTVAEEIDGRDGDIITKLGYSAYDKPMKIGLYGDYDVNDVIEYFDTEGIVIFSNEADKYYKFEIIDQIDFERLIRFRTATVNFHVQPFKYSAVDEKLSFETDGIDSISVTNWGNIYSKPRITVYGAETVTLSLNGTQILSINLGETEWITIDSALMNAFKGDLYMNRNVSGDYDRLRLKQGRNTLTWSGDLTKIEIENYSRWR